MKTTRPTSRKHNCKARLQILPREVFETSARPRLKTSLTFESDCQSYLWVTDRGRSRLIKH
ncbi:MAG: hypothetical protein KGO96_01545 [Elusimicrobia bacterium]|nr:hypothetical protein [Elusimicrobiota bacterium]